MPAPAFLLVPSDPRFRVGELGCRGIDLEKWRTENRVPLFPGKMNRWLLARTLRDNPTAQDIRETMNFTFSKWFEGMVIDPLLATSEGGRAGGGIFENMVIDNLRVVTASKKPLRLEEPAMRREQLSEGPLPMVNPEGGVIFIEAAFAYRGQKTRMPWPVRSGAPGGFVQLRAMAECPVNADWILLAAGKPLKEAPAERGMADILQEKAKDAIVPIIKISLWPVAAILGAVGVAYLARRQIGL